MDYEVVPNRFLEELAVIQRGLEARSERQAKKSRKKKVQSWD